MAQEHSVFTWDPVGARWIHERGPEMTTPPVPPDVHAIQTYFFDPEGNEWIATVLAPRGRELAARWSGAYKVPDRAAPTRSTQNVPNASPAAPSSAPGDTTNPSAPVAVPGQPTATAADATPTTQPDAIPATTVAATRAPVRTPVPTVAPPAATSVTLADGSVVTYSGPARVNIGAAFAVTFTVRNANNTPGSGTFLVSFGDASTGGAKTSSGTLDPGGRITLNMTGLPLPGNYPFVVNYKGQQGQVAILRVG